MKKGFTLIELLIVIAILGVLSAVVLVGLDPIDKINAANDSGIQNTISSLANATEAYAVVHDGNYPVAATIALLQPILVTSGDLKMALSAPANYAFGANSAAGGASVCGQLKSKKYTTGATYCNSVLPCTWLWTSATGRAVTSNNACP